MELWLDTIDLEAIQKAHELEILDGVTTNPAILSQAKEPLEKVFESILNAQEGPLAIQVTSGDLLAEAKALHRFSSRVIIKVPATTEGYSVIRTLSDEGIPVMATAIFEPQQAYLALKLGADYAAFYFGRILDGGKDPIDLLKSAQAFKKNEGFDGKLIAAGIRSVEQFNQIAQHGCDAITLPHRIFQELLATPSAVKKALKEFPSTEYMLEGLRSP